ncbi:signal peptidase I [Vagococcus silagei]|nr:signal peptidase I [Vagococcus silagei]
MRKKPPVGKRKPPSGRNNSSRRPPQSINNKNYRNSPKKRNENSVSKKSMLLIGLVVGASLFAIWIVLFIFTMGTARVIDDSMDPTLPEGVGLFYKRTDNLKLGDVVILTSPDDTRYQQVRRVVGLPGQKVDYLSDNSVVIDGVILQETYFTQEVKQTQEERLETVSMKQFLEATKSLTESMIEADKIPEDMILVLGDNRLQAYDSRYYGLVPIHEVYGKADMMFWPLKKIKNK